MKTRILTATALAVAIAGVTLPRPAAAQGDAQAQLRTISELARKALGYAPTCKDGPTTWVPENWYFNPDPAGPHYPQLFDSSPNKKLMARAWYYGWTLYAPASYLPVGNPGRTQVPTAAQRTEARNLLVQSLSAPNGHYTIAAADEVLTTTHFQLWAAGITSAYVLALGNGGVIQNGQDPYTSGDQNTSPDRNGNPITVRDAARLWWREEKALWDKLRSFPGGVATIDAPGARAAPCDPSLGVCAAGTGATQLRDKIDTFLRGQVPSGNTNFFDQCYNSSAWMMLKLQLEKSIVPGTVFAPAGATPKIYDTLCILKTQSGDFVYSFPTLRAALDPIFWVASVGGSRSYGPQQAGKPVNPNPAWPPPALPGATRDWVQGVVSGAFNGANCPSQ